MSFNAARIAYSLIKSKENRQLIKKILTIIFIATGVFFAFILSVAGTISNVNKDIVSRVFDGESIDDIFADYDPDTFKELKNQLEGIDDGFSAIDDFFNFYTENNFIVGEMLDPNWVKSVYYAVYIEHKISRSADWAFVDCFLENIPGDIFKEKVCDKNVVYEDLSEMLGWNITETAKHNAELIYAYISKSK